MPLKYALLDVFTDTPLAGNPLAVVFDADALDGEAMQKIAREFNLSETVFLLKPANKVHTARLRIFTPTKELPFAGHPTVGTAILLARSLWPGEGPREGLVVLEEEIGTVRVGVALDDGRSFAEFDIPHMPERVEPNPDKELAAAALGLMPSEIGFENHRPSRWSAGVAFPLLPVRNLDVMRRCRIERRAFEKAFGEAVYIYTRNTFNHDSDFQVRMFAPGLGLEEDPATGSAAAAFAGAVMQFDELPAGTHRYRIEQGHIMGRPSLVELELGVKQKGLEVVRIGGAAVVIAEGELRL